VTGNIIANEVAFPVPPTQTSPTVPPSWSLSVFNMPQPLGAPALAISGNILIDPPGPLLPTQNWQPLNTVISYSVVPTVTNVNPNSGITNGGLTPVTITGTGFIAATSVNFGSVAATAMTVQSDTQITVTTPAVGSVGPVDVTVITPAGTSATSQADQFLYTPGLS
jgi:hypothetical protein